ncbi:hypothetical protein [Mucilaginibacter sp. SG564]|uniref:hypothetical protein n=1 Tax=unclassified Mucilaginibacter TaxID=2617802 RepID=UPI001552C716|nr:hypothetical protein [Mucilaginibacter sp. SG564]NOW98920.1 hypothetical protein [Mucilaginibacter sp. SG564]
MKSFIRSVAIFIFLLVSFNILGILVIPPTAYVSNSLLSGKIKKDSLLRNTPSPRVILIGGSNVSFGIDSYTIKDSLKITPVNTAIHAGIGLMYMLSHTIPFVKKGDIVIISPEYEQYYGNLFLGSDELVRTIFDVSKSDYKYLTFDQWVHLTPYIIQYGYSKYNLRNLYFKRIPIYSPSDSVYLKSSFDKFGDATVHWKLKGITVPPEDIKNKGDQFNFDVIKQLKAFQAAAQQKGAIVYITYPGLQSSSFAKSVGQINQVSYELKKANFKLLGNPYQYRIPDSLCFDTKYHLIKKGVDMRTKLLIHDLKSSLAYNK